MKIRPPKDRKKLIRPEVKGNISFLRTKVSTRQLRLAMINPARAAVETGSTEKTGKR
jgi:hypothetical protein